MVHKLYPPFTAFDKYFQDQCDWSHYLGARNHSNAAVFDLLYTLPRSWNFYT
jgi:hypothetical protein